MKKPDLPKSLLELFEPFLVPIKAFSWPPVRAFERFCEKIYKWLDIPGQLSI